MNTPDPSTLILLSSAYSSDGGIYAATSSVVYINGTSSFIGNSALNGGGVYAVDISGTNNFIDNSAQYEGGGVLVPNAIVDIMISGTNNFIDNSAQVDGGGVDAGVHATVTIRWWSICRWLHYSGHQWNKQLHWQFSPAQVDGGGVCAFHYSTVDISGTNNFIDNSAQHGGGVFLGNVIVGISGTNNFIDNSAQNDGGGVCAYDYATADNSGTNNITDNSARWWSACSYATVDISGTNNFIDNSAQVDGDAMEYMQIILQC